MGAFYIGLIEYLRTVVGDTGFKEIDRGSDYWQTITVIHGNKEYRIDIREKELANDEADD